MGIIYSIISISLLLQVSPSLLAMVCGGFGFLLLLGVVVFKKPMDRIDFYNSSDQDDGESERRRSLRQQDPLKVSIRVLGEGDSETNEPVHFVNKDISENGIFIISEDLDILKPGQKIIISVFNENGPVFEGLGQVIHRQAVFSADMVAEEGGFGIKFLKKEIV